MKGIKSTALAAGTAFFFSSAMPGSAAENIESLHLEEVLELAEEDSNVRLIHYQMEMLREQEKSLEEQKEDLEYISVDESMLRPTDEEFFKQWEVHSGEDQAEEEGENQEEGQDEQSTDTPPDNPEEEPLQPWLEYQNQMNKIFNEKTKADIENTNNQIREQRKQMENSIDEAEYNQRTTTLQLSQIKESVQIQKTSQYIQLLALDEQADFAETLYQRAEREVERANLALEYGTGSKEQVTEREREMEDLKRDWEDVERRYQESLAQLSFDLGIDYHPDIELAPIELSEVEPVDRPSDVSAVVKNSYEYRIALEDWEWVKEQSEEVDGNDHAEEAAELQVRMKEEEVLQLETELKTRIDSIYRAYEQALEDVERAELSVERAEEDYRKAELQYDIGVIAKYNVENLKQPLEQAKFELIQAEGNLYAAKEQLVSLEDGFIGGIQ